MSHSSGRFVPTCVGVDLPLRGKAERRARELNRSVSWVVRAALKAYLAAPADPKARRPLPVLFGREAAR
jgi:hypothetical protein